MKLIYRIALSLSVIMLVFMVVWGIFFFNVMTSEINDETDDMLEEYSQDIIVKWLSGVRLPSTDNGTNNTYYIRKVTPEYAASVQWIRYENSDIYIAEENELEPARIRRQVFLDSDGLYYELTVAVPSFEKADLVRSILWSIVLLYMVLLIATVVITMVVIVYNMRPFNALMKWLDSYVPGKKNGPVPADTDVIEFRKLALAAQSTADRFERQYQLQNQFIGNASHELQTPLAVCLGRIEMLLDSPDITETQAQELSKMHRSIQDLIRLNKTLLLMSRIENGQYMATEEVDMGEMIRGSLELYGEIFSSSGAAVSVENDGDCIWRMNRQLASVLVNNLVKNAFSHSPEGGHIDVRWSGDSFRVSNDGGKSLDPDRVFTRFYQENAGKEGSTGLGLSLVKAVCDNSSLTVTYVYDGRHNFEVSLRKN